MYPNQIIKRWKDSRRIAGMIEFLKHKDRVSHYMSINWKSGELLMRTLKKSFVEFTKNPFQAISKATLWKLPAASGKYLQVLLKVLEKQLIYATVCSCHVTHTSQSESALYSCLNFKELLARSRREIWSLSDCNWTRTQNHLVRKRTLNHWAKLA